MNSYTYWKRITFLIKVMDKFRSKKEYNEMMDIEYEIKYLIETHSTVE